MSQKTDFINDYICPFRATGKPSGGVNIVHCNRKCALFSGDDASPCRLVNMVGRVEGSLKKAKEKGGE